MADHNEGIEHGYHAHLGKVSKRINSTKRIPLTDLPDEFPFYMKRACSMEAPVFYVRLNSLNISPQYNYCYIEETHAYYWIEDITALNANNWQFSCAIDPLATFADSIKKTKAYILYGFNSDASGAQYRLQDTRQNVANAPLIYTATDDITDGNIDTSTGVYILSAVGKSGLNTYALDAGTMRSLLTVLSTTWLASTAAMVRWEVALPQFMNNLLFGSSAVDCIRSCFWLPINYSRYGAGRQSSITLGQFETGLTGRLVAPSSSRKVSTSIPIPWPVSDWKRMNCQVQMYVPFVGTVVIPTQQCNNQLSVDVDWTVSFMDGSVTTHIKCGDYTVYAGSTSIASPYAVGTSNFDFFQQAAGALTTTSGLLEYGTGLSNVLTAYTPQKADQGLQGMIGGMQGILGGIKQTMTPINCAAGTMAGNSQCLLPLDAKVTVLYYRPIDDDGYQGLYGYPVMRVTTPANGYCQTRGFSVEAPMATAAETSYINAAMDGGVFIE